MAVSNELCDALASLAQTPDDSSEITLLLERIATLSVTCIADVNYASVTATVDGSSTTVAMTNEVALAVDEAQYADDSGPCLDALAHGAPVSVPDIVSLLVWPSFRAGAQAMGVRASLSVPLAAGSGQVVAALNLYSREPLAFVRLSYAVQRAFDSFGDATSERPVQGLDPGGAALVQGITTGQLVQHRIQAAVGLLIAREGATPASGYVMLRSAAAAAGRSLSEMADELIRGSVAGP